MSSKSMHNQSSIYKYNSDEFWDLHEALVPILEKHFANVVSGFNSSGDAHWLIGIYETKRADSWEGKKAADTLYKLSKLLRELNNEWRNIPGLVKDDLAMNADAIDDENKGKFFDENSYWLPPKSEYPSDFGRDAVSALNALVEGETAIIASIEKSKNELPKGIKTRNRPINEWSVISAAAELVRAYGAMDIPNNIDSTNPSGPFYRFLEELFPLFKTTNSVAGTFKGWKAKFDNKIDNSDLMPI